jgi:hypothetical protein
LKGGRKKRLRKQKERRSLSGAGIKQGFDLEEQLRQRKTIGFITLA